MHYIINNTNRLTDRLTNYMEQSPYWEADTDSTSQEIPCLLRNPGVYYRILNSPPLVPILSQLNPIHAITPYLFRH